MATGLTDRQFDVLRLVCDGKGIKETAAALSIAPQTVKNNLSGVYRVLRAVGAIRPEIADPRTPACVWWHRGLAAYRGND